MFKRLKELKQRIRLAWAILTGRDGNLLRHAQDEFAFAGYHDGDKMNALMARDVLDLLRVFGTQGHSGMSASFARQTFDTLAAFEPLGPLTGEDTEWFDHGPGMDRGRFQNKRCGHVFKDLPDGPAYDIDAVIFEEPDGSRFTSYHSRRVVTFPYAPRSVVVQLPDNATDVQREMLAALAWAKAA
jgi:hypothetical protein